MRCLHSPKVHGRVGHALPYTPLTTSRHPLNTSNHSPKVHGRVGHALLADKQPINTLKQPINVPKVHGRVGHALLADR